MAKCKDCECLGWNPVCRRWHTLNMVPVGDHNAEWDCSWFEPGPKPLMDELAEALNWLLHLLHDVSRGGNDPETGQPYPVTDGEWEAAIAEGERVHTRYQKEQADGQQ